MLIVEETNTTEQTKLLSSLGDKDQARGARFSLKTAAYGFLTTTAMCTFAIIKKLGVLAVGGLSTAANWMYNLCFKKSYGNDQNTGMELASTGKNSGFQDINLGEAASTPSTSPKIEPKPGLYERVMSYVFSNQKSAAKTL